MYYKPVKTCAVIPAYNAEARIGDVVQKIKKHDVVPVVVNDGSCDHTESTARCQDAVVINCGKNLGKGAAMRLGFQYALAHDFDLIFTIDADGQHDAGEIPKFLKAIAGRDDVAIVIGSRMDSRKTMPFVRWCTNRFMSSLLSMLSHTKIEDSQCGYRLLRRQVLEAVRLSTNKYEIDSELLLKAARKGFVIVSVPVNTIYDLRTPSKIHPIIDTLRFIKFILTHIGQDT